MRILSTLVALLAALFYRAGTESEVDLTKGIGDLGDFLLEQVESRGGKSISKSDLPTLKYQWGYSVDKYGVFIQLPPEHFAEVQRFLEQAFGPPSQEPSETTDGGAAGWYAVDAIGVVLQFGYNPQRTQIIIVRPVSAGQLAWRIPLSWFRRS